MRIRNVLQLHTVNRMQSFGWPLIIMGMALAVVLAIGGIAKAAGIGEADLADMYEGMRFNGAIFSLLGPVIGFGFLVMGQYFPLALGLGLTRREFALGTGLLFVLEAVGYTVVVSLGRWIEDATTGFGLHIRFFDVVYTSIGPWWHTPIQAFVLILAAMLIGAAISSAFHRWGQPFLWVFWIVLAVIGLAIGGLLALVPSSRPVVWDMVQIGWGPWMGVVAVVAVIAGSVWFALVRHVQVD